MEHGGKRSPAERAQPAPARADRKLPVRLAGERLPARRDVPGGGTDHHHQLPSYLGQPYGPTPKADVGYTVNEINGTVAVVDSDPDTEVFPAGLSQSGSFAYDYQVTGDHTDTVQVLSADQNQVLAQASATVKVNVWSLDIAKAVTGISFTRDLQLVARQARPGQP